MDLATTIHSLYQQYGQLPGITIECQNELLAIGIKNKAAVAEVFLQGAQLTHYQRIGEAPLLFLSEACHYRSGESLRGGIPICWPWFGDITKNPDTVQQMLPVDQRDGAPAHGFVRDRDWQLDAITTPTDTLTVVELSYTTQTDEPLWPHTTTLHYRIEIGVNVKVTFSVTNNSQHPFTFSSALHSYFSINDIENVRIQGFDQADYIDALDDWVVKTQDSDVTFTEELDRIYKRGDSAVTIDDGSRKVHLSSTGSNSSVIWNPWIDKSQNLSQFKHNDFQTMLCIETANVMDDSVHLMPQQTHKLQLTLA